MSDRQHRRWQYGGTAGGRPRGRKSERSTEPTLAVAGPVPRDSQRRTAQRRAPAGRPVASEHRAWRRPRLGDLLIWTAMAVVAGAFLGLLARQTWVVALVAGTVVAIYVWRELR